MDVTCASIYEQFFVCFEVEILYRDLIYVISYYKESRFFFKCQKMMTHKKLWTVNGLKWVCIISYHIQKKFNV